MLRRSALSLLFVLGAGLSPAQAQESTPSATTADAPSSSSPTEAPALTLANALGRALEQNPGLAPYAWDLRIAEARRLQAGLRPNPELAFEIEGLRWKEGPGQEARSFTAGVSKEALAENASGLGLTPSLELAKETSPGAASGLQNAEMTLLIEQLVELGGKRVQRIRLAEKDIGLAQWDGEVARADVLTETARCFLEALAAQTHAALTSEFLAFTEDVRRTTEIRVQAGEISPLELHKANVEVTAARADHEAAKEQLTAARIALAGQWGSHEPDFGPLAGALDAIEPIPALDALLTSMERNPDLARWADELEQREAAYNLERAKRIPDLMLGLGLKTEGMGGSSDAWSTSASLDGSAFGRTFQSPERDWDTSVVFQISVPLPLFNRNQGGIEEARYQQEKAVAEQRARHAAMAAQIAKWYHLGRAAETRVAALSKEAIPEAAQTFQLTQEGFRQGKFTYLDVLDTERTLIDLRSRLLDAQRTHHEVRIEIARLAGTLDALGGVPAAGAKENTHE